MFASGTIRGREPDLYVVFNEGRNTWLDREVPHLPAYDQRNITLKFSYTFEVQR